MFEKLEQKLKEHGYQFKFKSSEKHLILKVSHKEKGVNLQYDVYKKNDNLMIFAGGDCLNEELTSDIISYMVEFAKRGNAKVVSMNQFILYSDEPIIKNGFVKRTESTDEKLKSFYKARKPTYYEYIKFL